MRRLHTTIATKELTNQWTPHMARHMLRHAPHPVLRHVLLVASLHVRRSVLPHAPLLA